MVKGKFITATLCLLLLGGCVTQQQFDEQKEQLNASLAIIQANQVKLVTGQALGNATLSMIHATAQESLALQQQQAAGGTRGASK